MRALIIAAGMGNRLHCSDRGIPKPLTPFLGSTIVESVMALAQRGGIDDFVLVVGFQGDLIRKRLGDGQALGVRISYLENREWERGNGLSVLKAQDLLDQRFLLLMSDHLFEPSILREARGVALGEDETLLVVDRAPWEQIDMDDATKVRVEGERIVDIGKGIGGANAVDCGMFLVSPLAFGALEESVRGGDESLSGGMRLLAQRGKLRPHCISRRVWFDLDTPRDIERATRWIQGNPAFLRDLAMGEKVCPGD